MTRIGQAIGARVDAAVWLTLTNPDTTLDDAVARLVAEHPDVKILAVDRERGRVKIADTRQED